jgi:cell division protein FtsI/penicillin-binding protein 2
MEGFIEAWREGGHKNVNLKKALMVSSNTYFFKLAYQSDIKDLASYFSLFGFGSRVCRDCFDEDPAFVPSPEWKYKNFNIHGLLETQSILELDKDTWLLHLFSWLTIFLFSK